MTTAILCRACRMFFDKRAPACPECGAEKTPVNPGLASQAWRTSLLNNTARAVADG